VIVGVDVGKVAAVGTTIEAASSAVITAAVAAAAFPEVEPTPAAPPLAVRVPNVVSPPAPPFPPLFEPRVPLAPQV
jgi:hypothetical protein